jgi:hypothetical protein
VEATLRIEQAVGGKDMEVRVEEEVIAKSVDGGDSGESAVGQVETGAKGFEQGVGGGFEQKMEEVAALAENAAQGFRDGEDELAVGDFVADGGGDPLGALADPALMAGGAEVAAFAGEGEEAFVAAIRAVEAEETGGKIAAAEEGFDGGRGGGARRSGATMRRYATATLRRLGSSSRLCPTDTRTLKKLKKLADRAVSWHCRKLVHFL